MKIEAKFDLWDCEKLLTTVNKSTAPVKIQLSKISRKIHMKDLRIVPIISAVSQAGIGTCSWEDTIAEKNYDPLINLAMNIYRVTEENRQSDTSIENIKKSLAIRKDILEDPPGSKETLTVCAIDQRSRSCPLAFPTKFDKKQFIQVFEGLVEDYFDYGSSANFSKSLGGDLLDKGPSILELIFGFIYELYQNTYDHGCLDKNHRVIPGLRLIRLRKRIGYPNSRDSFIQGARGFAELESFFKKTAPRSKNFKYYEISISDNGMGIVNRFRHMTKESEQNPRLPDSNLQLLNEIVEKSLSSDFAKSGKGEGGLKNVLKAIDKVRGFVSLRCNDLWVYRNSEDSEEHSGNWLRHVGKPSDLAEIAGTHFTIYLLASTQ